MKVLLILGSPRANGNTTKIARIIEESLSATQAIEWDIMQLYQKNMVDWRFYIVKRMERI